MIQVLCSQCGLRILVPPTVQGKTGSCFNCGHALTVPTAADIRKHLDLSYEPGDRVADRYVIEQPIGKGGMGMVYRAHDTLVDETVALKFMKPQMLRTERGQKLFIKEAQIARRLRHEHVVAVHDVSWTSEGILYLSMELAEGQSLRGWLRRYRSERRLVDVRIVVSFVTQILRALEYAHRTVVHRDIKPENIMVLPGEQIKVLDFGLALAVLEEILDEKAEKKENPEGNKVIGTLAYAAPEQKRRHAVDLRADIYAVGLVMHELLTLRTPLDPPVTVPQVRDDVSPSILAVLKRAVEEVKEGRWQSARDFRVALDKAFDESYRRHVQPVVTTSDGSGTDRDVDTSGMVYLAGGSFLMGSNELREAQPEQEVEVAPFWIDRYPVTVEAYAAYLEATGVPEPRFWRDTRYNGSNQPVIGVNWDEAQAYAQWAGKRLPTEAQWEFAARGLENRRYPWGSLPPDPTLANFNDFLGMPSIVSMYEDGQTPDGVYDLAGNVLEWTLDPFVPYLMHRRSPEQASAAPRRAVRGGAFSSPAEELQSFYRKGLFPESRLPITGFRCVLPAD